MTFWEWVLLAGGIGIAAVCALDLPARAASCSSYPFTLQNNTTADATQVMANFNQVRNCVINNAAGSGVNTDITAITGLSTPLSVPQGGTPVFIGGTSTGTANAQVVASPSPIGYSLTNGYRITFTAGATNTAATTLNVNSTGATAMRKIGPAGLEALSGGEIVSGNIVEAIYNGTFFVLLGTDMATLATRTNITTGTTVDLGTIPTHNARITSAGSSIASFGSTAVVTDPVYLISFAGINTLVYNATSMIVPGSGNITTAADDTAVVEYLGSGNWQVLSYIRRSGAGIVAITPLCGADGFTAINNAGTPDTSYDMAARNVVMVTTAGVPITASAVSVTINATGTGANGLDAGSLAAATWYYGWLINNGTTTAGLLSTSSTAPTMPATYVYKCRLSSIRTAAGGATFLRMLSFGNDVWHNRGAVGAVALPIIVPATTTGDPAVPTWTTFATTNFVPPTGTHLHLTMTGNNAACILAESSAYGNRTSLTNPPPFGINTANDDQRSGTLPLPTANIYAALTNNGCIVQAKGYRENVNAN